MNPARRRPNIGRSTSPSSASVEPPKSKVDTWLVRLANTSQLGLLALAAFGYVYTVLPVYQKSLLDEEIAKKTLELYRKDAEIAERSKELNAKTDELSARTEELQAKGRELEALDANAKQLQSALTRKQSEVGQLRSSLSEQYSDLRVRLAQEFQTLGASMCSLETKPPNAFAECLITMVLPMPTLTAWTQHDRELMKRLITAQGPIATAAWADYA